MNWVIPKNLVFFRFMIKLPNILTISRIVLTPIYLYLIYKEVFWIAILLFIFAIVSDILDGVIARRNKQVSDFGKIADPIADKIFTNSSFIVFCIMGYFSWIWVAIILARELLITVLRVIMARKEIIIPADIYGKVKTIFQFITIGGFLVRGLFLFDIGFPKEFILITILKYFSLIMLIVSVFFAILSGINYLFQIYKLSLNRKSVH